MTGDTIDPRRLRELRDAAILYLYNHTAASSFNISSHELASQIGASGREFDAVIRLMMSQGLEGNTFTTIGSVGLSSAGLDEAERLGPSIRMRAKADESALMIHANYGVIQVAGDNSNQTASMTLSDHSITALLNEIDVALPGLPLDDRAKTEAKALLQSLADGIRTKLNDAGMRAIGAALAGVLIAAGSDLGQRLMRALHIVAG